MKVTGKEGQINYLVPSPFLKIPFPENSREEREGPRRKRKISGGIRDGIFIVSGFFRFFAPVTFQMPGLPGNHKLQTKGDPFGQLIYHHLRIDVTLALTLLKLELLKNIF
jgi:hypothetical protein